MFDRVESSKNDIYNLCKKVNFHLKYDILYDFIFGGIYMLFYEKDEIVKMTM